MNRNAIANKIYAELFGGPAPAPAPAPTPAPAPAPPRVQQVGRGLMATGKFVGRGLMATGKFAGRGLMATTGGLAKAGRSIALKTESLEQKLVRAQLNLENMKKHKNAGNTGITNQSIINKQVFIEGLKGKVAKKGLYQNNKSTLKTNNKSTLKTNNKAPKVVEGVTMTGNGRGGQQIIFGGGAPGQAPAAAAAPYPFPMAGQAPAAAAPYPFPMGGGAAPHISVKVNARGPNVGMPRGLNVPPPSPSQVNMVQNAGGPVAIREAVTALKRANGNINTAMRATGLPRQTFTNVKNLGGVNIAPRIAASVVRHRKRRTTTKKKPTHKVRKPSVRTNRIKKVVHKVPRKNLEHFVLLWALRRKR